MPNSRLAVDEAASSKYERLVNHNCSTVPTTGEKSAGYTSGFLHGALWEDIVSVSRMRQHLTWYSSASEMQNKYFQVSQWLSGFRK